jgi:stress-induced morphogen
MSVKDRIEDKLTQALAPVTLEVIDINPFTGSKIIQRFAR